ncbi:MAG TPA: hypothetical protein PLV68_04700, partial [Ilumatobacteraceae bacterium]|nr:hypothetical protein [Ilumatobacteraceae bacterium]
MYSLFVDHTDRVYLGAGGRLLRSDDLATTWTVLEDGLDGVSVYEVCERPDGLLVIATSGGL